MRRRHVLAAATLAATGSAGCLDRFETGGTVASEAGPEATARAFAAALDDGDGDAFDDLVHEDSEVRPLSAEDRRKFAAANVELETVAVEREDDEAATAAIELDITDPSGESETVPLELELRRDGTDGEWKLWSVAEETDGPRSTPPGPQAAVDVEQAVEGGDLTGVTVTLTTADRLDDLRFVGCGGYEEPGDLDAVGDSTTLDTAALANACDRNDGISIVGTYDGRQAILHQFTLRGDPTP